MRSRGNFLPYVGLVVAILILGLAAVMLGYLTLVLGFAVVAFYGWVVSAYFHYRYGRQEELAFLLASAAEAEAPLAPAIRAYLADRPHGVEREFWVAVLLFFVVPGYYWVWHRRHSFDHKLARVASRLEAGVSLHAALRSEPGIAAPETVLAAAVGESTGRLAQSLRGAARGRLTPVWLEVLPRLAYPLLLLLILASVVSFCATFIIPKYQKIFADFGIRLPAATRWLVAALQWAVGPPALLPVAVVVLAGLMVLWVVDAKARWYWPVLGRLNRMAVQSRFLRSLALLLETGVPVPRALAALGASGYFTGPAGRRLEAARVDVERGEPLADALERRGLLPAAMTLLVRAAEKARNLPWALTELAETLGTRSVRLAQRLSMLVAPLTVVLVGALVGFFVVGMFLPLVTLIAEMPP